jgi:phage regulator Rha-like protein
MQNLSQVAGNGLMAMLLMDDQTMSSMEIARLVGLRHDNVKRTISTLIEKGVIRFTPLEDFENINNLGFKASIAHYLIGKRDSYVVVAQLSPEFVGKPVKDSGS